MQASRMRLRRLGTVRMRSSPDGSAIRCSPYRLPRIAKPGEKRQAWVPVQVVVAAVPSSSALAWLDHARKVLSVVSDEGFPVRVPDDVLLAFGSYLDEWLWAADAGPVFNWSGEIDAEVACHLVHHWHGLARWVAEAGQGVAQLRRPPQGDAFYTALVASVTDALALDECTHAFGEAIRSSWPGLPTR